MFSKKSFKFVMILILITVLLLVVIRMSLMHSSVTRGVEEATNTAFNPLQKGTTSVSNYFGSLFYNLTHMDDILTENKALAEENSQLKAKLNQYDELLLENQQMRSMMNFNNRQTEYDLLGAEIIGRDTETWFDVITINKGSKDGIQTDMPVITENGIVGRILEAGRNWSKVMLILDERSSISGMLQQTREVGIVKGSVESSASRGLLQMVYIAENAKIQAGDLVISSGLGDVFPKGLVIGEVVEVEKDPLTLFYSATVKPAVDLDRLEKVFILMNYNSPLEEGVDEISTP